MKPTKPQQTELVPPQALAKIEPQAVAAPSGLPVVDIEGLINKAIEQKSAFEVMKELEEFEKKSDR